MKISSLLGYLTLALLFVYTISEELDPKSFVTQSEISESTTNGAAHRTTQLGTYSAPTNMIISVGLVILNGTLEEADLNSTLYTHQNEVVSLKNLHVAYPNRPAKNFMLQFDSCELERRTNALTQFYLTTDLLRDRGSVISSVYFISRYATFSQNQWMWLEPDFLFAKYHIALEEQRPADARNIAIELQFELVVTDKSKPPVNELIQSISLTDKCNGEVDVANVQVDPTDPHRATVTYLMINSLNWVIWITPSQLRIFGDKSLAFRATVKTYEDTNLWCEPGQLYCESTVISPNSTSSSKSVQIALGFSIGIGAAATIGLSIALYITYKRLQALQLQVWGDGALDYRELRPRDTFLPEDDPSF